MTARIGDRIPRSWIVAVAVAFASLPAAPAAGALTWGSPVTVSAAGELTQNDPSTAIDANGDVAVAWASAASATFGCPCSVRVAVRPADGSFGAPQTLDTAVTGDSIAGVRVAMDAAGDVIVVWSHGAPKALGPITGMDNTVYASVRPAGGSFGTPQQISGAPAGADAGGDPLIRMDNAGDAVIGWVAGLGWFAGNPEPQLEIVRRAAGGSFSAPAAISVAGSGNPWEFQLAMSPDGHAAVALTFESPTGCDPGNSGVCDPRQNGASENVQVAVASPRAAFGTAQAISPTVSWPGTPGSGPAVSAQSVAIDDHGDVAAAYEAIGDGPIMTNTRRDEVVTSDAGGAFSPPQSLGASGRSFADHVVIAPNGTATETLTDSNGLEASSRPLGGTFGAPHVISAVAEGDALANPANLSGSSGEMLDGLLLDDAAFDGQNLHVAAALAPAGGPFGAPVTVEQLPAGSTFSAIDGSIDASGDAAALSWNESPSTDSAGVIRVAVAGDGQSTGPGGGQPGGGHPGNGTPPNTKLTGKEIDRKHHRATFTFKAIGSATGFRCALITKTRHTHPKPRFSACRSPKSYKHLKHGHYTFEVAAVGSAGADRTPAIARFTT